jgi:hypothetical protein
MAPWSEVALPPNNVVIKKTEWIEADLVNYMPIKKWVETDENIVVISVSKFDSMTSPDLINLAKTKGVYDETFTKKTLIQKLEELDKIKVNYESLSKAELTSLAKEKGIFENGMSKAKLLEVLNAN